MVQHSFEFVWSKHRRRERTHLTSAAVLPRSSAEAATTMDALGEVLGHIRLKDTSWACYVASSPWGVSLREAKGWVRFLYVMRGSCWLSIDKTSQPRVALSGGDLAVMPQGHGYAIRDQPRSSAISFDELVRRNVSPTQTTIHHLKIGGAGVQTNMIH